MPRKEDITGVHYRAAELYFTGSTQQEIADAVGVHASTVFRWIRDGKLDPILDELADEMRKAVRRRLMSQSLAAADAAVAVLASEDDGKKLSAAFGILDRTGHPKSERIEMDADVRAKVDVASPIESLDSMMTGGGGEQ